MPAKQFVFLLCTERSGSNLLTCLLDAHTQVCGPSPAHLILSLTRHPNRYAPLAEEEGWQALVRDALALFETKTGYWRTHWRLEELLELTPRSIGSLVRAMFAREAAACGASHVIIKESHAWRFMPLLLAEFEAARFLWLVRDPRDVALSWRRLAEIPGEAPTAMDYWCEDQAAFASLWHQLAPTGRLARVHYEELVTAPQVELTRICEWLGLDYEPAMLGFHAEPLTRQNAGTSAAWSKLASPLNAASVGAFREGSSEEELAYVEWRARELMATLGYPPAVEACRDGAQLERGLRARERREVDYSAMDPERRRSKQRRKALLAELAERPVLALRKASARSAP